jgi:hypothetical protein
MLSFLAREPTRARALYAFPRGMIVVICPTGLHWFNIQPADFFSMSLLWLHPFFEYCVQNIFVVSYLANF